MTLIDFTLSNARRFYSSMGNPLAAKGLSSAKGCEDYTHSFQSAVQIIEMHLYSAFSTCIYSNALYNTLWGTLPDCFTTFLVQQVEFTGAPRTERVMPDHNTGNLMPYSLRIVCGFFNVPQLFKGCETGPPAYSPYPRRLESLTIC